MTVDSIIQEILASRRDLTREEILRMIEEKVKSAEGYFTDEAAARTVASELGIKTPQKRLPEISIKNLVSGLNDVTVTGRIIYVSPSRGFKRSNETEGLIKRLQVADKSGVINVVVWNDKAKQADDLDIRPGQIGRFSHGYVRQGLDGRVELNLGARGEIELLPKEAIQGYYPPLESFIKKIEDITQKDRNVNVLGVVRKVSPESRFKRKDGSAGKVRSVWLRDSSGEIRVVFWNNKADEIEGLKKGNYSRIMNAKVRSGIEARLELHVGEESIVTVSTERFPGLDSLPSLFTKVGDVTPGTRNIEILARVAGVGEIRKLDRRETGYFSKLLIEDETGSVQLNLWGDNALLSKRIKPGDIILVKGAYAQKKFGGLLLNLNDKGSIAVNPEIEEAENLPILAERITEIADIKEGECITVQGTVLTTPNLREVITRRGKSVKVASLELSDDTEKVEVSLWRGLAEAAEELSIGDLVKIRNIYVRRNPLGKLRLTSGMLTSLDKLPKNGKDPNG